MTDPYINFYSAHKSTFLELPQQQKPPPTKPVLIPARTCTTVTARGAVPASGGALPWSRALPVPASTGTLYWCLHPVRCLHAVGPAAVPVSRGAFALVSVGLFPQPGSIRGFLFRGGRGLQWYCVLQSYSGSAWRCGFPWSRCSPPCTSSPRGG